MTPQRKNAIKKLHAVAAEITKKEERAYFIDGDRLKQEEIALHNECVTIVGELLEVIQTQEDLLACYGEVV